MFIGRIPYNSYGKVATRTDAKGQQVVYSYDFYARLTEVQRYPTPGVEDVCQREVYYYDGNDPSGSGYPQNALGRLSAVQYWGGYNPTSSPTCDTTFTEMYTYGVPGAPVGKQVQVTRTLQWPSENNAVTKNVALSATFTYDNEGRMTAETYPTDNNGTTDSLSYTFDNMGRLNTMADGLSGVTLITGASYGPANELLSITGNTYNGAYLGETRTYNSLKQLTGITSGTWQQPLSIGYTYPATGNNGKIAWQTDLVSGETVTYSYDALNRLATATTQSNISVPWGQSFTYDGFGNLTNVGVTQGSTPTLTASYDGNNHAGGEDANGNPSSIPAPAYGTNVQAGYDVENRLVSGAARCSYAPDNKRVWRGAGGWNSDTGQWSPTDEVTFWSVSGQKLATYQLTTSLGVGPPSPSQPVFYATQTATNYYFGSKLIKDNNGWVYSDRLGSIGKFYPYGIERPSATTNGTEKFTGYFRDSESGNDYAVNRYMSPGMGRFITPDRGTGGAKTTDPESWNKYAYTGGDPINRIDRHGNDYEDCDAGDCVLTWTSVGVGYEEQESLFEQDPNSPCYGTDPSSPACDEFLGSMFPGVATFQAPAASTPTTAAAQPECSISLYGRPVPFGKSPADHTYIDATIDNPNGTDTTVIIEGGPNPAGWPIGVLVGYTSFTGVGALAGTNPNSPTNHQIGSPYTGSSACADITQLENNVSQYNNGPSVTYVAVPTLVTGGYNSNSFTYTLLNNVGLAFSFGSLPRWTPGWELAVPGL